MNEVQSPWEPQPNYDTKAVTAITKEAGKIGRKIGKEIVKALQEKELTWADIQLIDHFVIEVEHEENEGKDYGGDEAFYQEVLRRFNKWRTEQ